MVNEDHTALHRNSNNLIAFSVPQALAATTQDFDFIMQLSQTGIGNEAEPTD